MTKLKRIGIIAAMQEEADEIKNALESPRTRTISGIDYVEGKYRGKEVIAAKCGVGKVFAAVCAQTMILEFAPDCIINTGVAGGLDPSLSIGDTVIGEKTVQHDMDTSPLGDEVGMVSGINMVYFPCDSNITALLMRSAREENIKALRGTVACGDKFISDCSDKEYLIRQFGACACDMESAAISHVCRINNVPFGVLRCISDGAGDEAFADFAEFLRFAAERSVKITKRFLTLD